MSVLLLVGVAAIVLFIAFGPILRQANEQRFQINPHALANPSGRLGFRHPRSSDVELLDKLYGDPASIDANFWDAESVASTRAMLRDRRRFEPWAQMSIVGTLGEGDEVVGLATLGTEDNAGRSGLSIGLQMVPSHRGKGLATELLAAMISATRELTDGEIWIGTSIANHPVRHMMDRLGYEPEPATDPYVAPDGTLVESVWFRVGADAAPPRFP